MAKDRTLILAGFQMGVDEKMMVVVMLELKLDDSSPALLGARGEDTERKCIASSNMVEKGRK